jgi:mono/diheme cytochrome c family protein
VAALIRPSRLFLVAGLACATALVLSAARTGRSPAARLVARDPAAWTRVVAALQQISEEYYEALESEDQAAVGKRLGELAAFLDRTMALIPREDERSEEVQRQLQGIRARLLGVDYRIGPDCKGAVERILAFAPLARTPRLKPDLANGRRVFAAACAACHGSDGSGQQPGSNGLEPPPPNILHPHYNWTPYEMFNRVTYGGVETAMPSFEEGLTPEERWDVVFHLFAERWPPCTQRLPPIAAEELALSGDFELGNKFGYGAAACLRRDFRAPASTPPPPPPRSGTPPPAPPASETPRDSQRRPGKGSDA